MVLTKEIAVGLADIQHKITIFNDTQWYVKLNGLSLFITVLHVKFIFKDVVTL